LAQTKQVTAKGLETLGAPRLAALLLESAENDDQLRRRLVLALAAAEAPDKLAKQVRKRFSAIARARKFLDWNETKPLARELDDLLSAIVRDLAQTDATAAHELLWTFLGIASSVYGRADDSNGNLGAVFAEARSALAVVASKAEPDPAALADRLFEALND
jgi:hypothetical protein